MCACEAGMTPSWPLKYTWQAQPEAPLISCSPFPEGLPDSIAARLDVQCQIDELVAVVEMDLETAVASAVAAESVPGASLEALKAQAVATRSYYLASRSRHGQFDFCDTTHCQFLREPPSPHSLAAQAAAATRGLVLFYDGAPVPALFTGSCGGRTRTLAEIGLAPAPYPYFSVPCNYCLQHSPHWQARLEAEEAAGLASHSEARPAETRPHPGLGRGARQQLRIAATG